MRGLLMFFLHLTVFRVFHGSGFSPDLLGSNFSGPSISGSRFFSVQDSQDPGFLKSRFFWVKIFQGLGFSGSESRF